MNISGVIVLAALAKYPAVKEQLLALPGVDIPIDNEDGRMVVIIDEAGAKASGEVLMKIQTIDGVLSANLVYQHVEETNQDGTSKTTETKTEDPERLL